MWHLWELLELPVVVLNGTVLLPAVLLPVEPTKEQMLLLLLTNNKQDLALTAYDGNLKNQKICCALRVKQMEVHSPAYIWWKFTIPLKTALLLIKLCF